MGVAGAVADELQRGFFSDISPRPPRMIGLIEGERHVLREIPLVVIAGIIPDGRAHRALVFAVGQTGHGRGSFQIGRPVSIAEIFPVSGVEVADLCARHANEIERGTGIPVAVIGHSVNIFILFILRGLASVLTVFEKKPVLNILFVHMGCSALAAIVRVQVSPLSVDLMRLMLLTVWRMAGSILSLPYAF